MTKAIAGQKSIPELAESLRLRGRAVFRDKEVRDAVVKWLRSKGVTCIVNRLSDYRLHPRHVTDFVGQWSTHPSEYQRRWSHLYTAQLV